MAWSATSPSVNAAGPSWRMIGDLISCSSLFCTAGICSKLSRATTFSGRNFLPHHEPLMTSGWRSMISAAVTMCDRVARMGHANAVTPTSPGFMRSGHSSGVRIPASGSRRQQRWRLPRPRSYQFAIEGHRQPRVCIDQWRPRPWPEDCSHSPFASPSDRARQSPGWSVPLCRSGFGGSARDCC
jgi:hypothetical protein